MRPPTTEQNDVVVGICYTYVDISPTAKSLQPANHLPKTSPLTHIRYFILTHFWTNSPPQMHCRCYLDPATKLNLYYFFLIHPDFSNFHIWNLILSSTILLDGGRGSIAIFRVKHGWILLNPACHSTFLLRQTDCLPVYPCNLLLVWTPPQEPPLQPHQSPDHLLWSPEKR